MPGRAFARRAAALLLLLVFVSTFAGCRERPKDEPVAAQDEISDEDAYEGFEEEALTGKVAVDGSSTLAPFMTRAAERFGKENPQVKVTVGTAGTGGGLERFCKGETDVAMASRPIEDDERDACAQKRILFLEVQVANDGITVAVNAENDWAKCLTVDQLKGIWEPSSEVDSWHDVSNDFPEEKLPLYGPGTDSGTFDFFTEAIVGEEGKSRSDYTASEDDNVVVRGVTGQKGALGYLGLSYVEENEGKLRAVEIDAGEGCIAPSNETVQNGSYEPLSRPLYVYVNRDSLEEKLAVDAFLTHVLDNQRPIARAARTVPLTQEQVDRSRTILEGASIDAATGEG